MPPLTRWFIKASFVGLVLALATRVSMEFLAPPLPAALTPVYFHLFLWGWVTQIIFGVAYWMFPRYSREQPRGHEGAWQATFWLLNVGLLFRVIGEPLISLNPAPLWNWLTAASAIMQGLAGLLFVANTWLRVKER